MGAKLWRGEFNSDPKILGKSLTAEPHPYHARRNHASVFSSPHFEFVILATFAAIALALLMAGILSVMAYTISLRTHEIGIRIALGARPQGILRMVLGKGIRLAVAGIAIGVGACFATMKFLRAFLFDVRSTDPITFVAV